MISKISWHKKQKNSSLIFCHSLLFNSLLRLLVIYTKVLFLEINLIKFNSQCQLIKEYETESDKSLTASKQIQCFNESIFVVVIFRQFQRIEYSFSASKINVSNNSSIFWGFSKEQEKKYNFNFPFRKIDFVSLKQFYSFFLLRTHMFCHNNRQWAIPNALTHTKNNAHSDDRLNVIRPKFISINFAFFLLLFRSSKSTSSTILKPIFVVYFSL